MSKRLEATVYGRVQGVSFRYYTQKKAQTLGLMGWVANDSDGSVHLVAEGTEEALTQLLQFLHIGSPYAQVNKVTYTWETPTNEFYRFSVRWQ